MRPGLRALMLILLLFCDLVAWAERAPADAVSGDRAAGAASPATPAELQQLIDTLKDPNRRNVLITTLENLRKVAPNPAATGPGAGAAAPGTAASGGAASGGAAQGGATTGGAGTGGAATGGAAQGTAETGAPAAAASVVALKPDSLGAQLIARGERLADTVSASLVLAVRGVTDIPDLLLWARGISEDPTMLFKGAVAAGRLLCVVLLAFCGEMLVWRLTHRAYVALAADAHRQDHEDLATVAGPSGVELSTPSPEPPATGLSAPSPEPSPAGLSTPSPPVTASSEPSPAAIAPEHAAAKRTVARDAWSLLRRLPFILMAAAVDLLPPLAFLAIAMLLVGTPLVATGAIRTVILAVVNAYVIVRIVGVVARASFGAPSARLRLLPVSDEAARYLMIWMRRIAVTIVFGYAVSQLALLFGMDSETQQGVLRLISLLVHIMLAAIVLQSRKHVAAWLAGSGEGRLASLRRMLASVWHVYAIIFIAGGWIIYAAETRDGFEQLIHVMLAAILVGLGARLADIVLVGALDRGLTVPENSSTRLARIEERVARYHAPLRFLLRFMISVAALVTLMQIWGIDALGWFSRGALGNRLVGSMATLLLTLGVAIVLWEAINVSMQVYLDELAERGAAIRAARLRTIVPLLRNALMITLMVLIVLTAMSEVGVNIGPLLAGASIFGVALGFGSQKLVQDFITGIFLLVENAMQVGDAVTAGGLSGTVENLSIRTLRLRAGDGSVHLIPFSSVTTVTNTNRGLGNAAVAVTVDYEEDTDRVGAVLARTVTEMRAEEPFSRGMLSDLQLWGVDRVDGSTVTLAGQIACTDSARWSVQREFNRRVKLAFQREGIRMMPTVSVTGFRHPLDIRLERPDATKLAAAPRQTGVKVPEDVGAK